MVLQLEDCIDVVKVLHPEYDYIFLLYHSCGLDRKRPASLCVNSMRRRFLGKQMVLRYLKVESEEYLGQFGGQLLSVGANQRMHFVPSHAETCRTLLDDISR
jgi:hypothetical protein